MLKSEEQPGTAFVRVTRALVKLLQERTVDGYVFRTDLRLRPDPASTQIAISVPAALDYYERSGQNWERAALIKARVCAGDPAAGEAFLQALSPFVWRKYFDFVALSDVHAMKRQIHVYRGHGDIAVEGHNIKLGRGGIREIEFFVQTQQLIAGGRHPELRGRETLAMLAALQEGGWIKPAVRADLNAAYRFLRTVEDRLQMVADEQTHTLPAEREDLDRFAYFLGFAGRDAFAETLLGHLQNVQKHYAALFENAPEAPGVQAPVVADSGKDIATNVNLLAERGFRQPGEAAATLQRWFAGSYGSLRSELAREHLAALLPLLIEQLARAESPDAALGALDRFLGALHGGARFYSLLRQNRDIVVLLATILATAPRLADILALQPEVMDAVLDPAFFGALPDEAALGRALATTLGQATTFEDFLDRTRIFGREHMFLIGVRVISGTVSAAQAGDAFAQLADVLIRALREAVEAKFVADHGRLRRQEAAVLAMGKLGGREMTAGSDLDLILIYDFDAKRPESDGPRPLYGGQYFARFTQRLINTLTVPTNYGKLYDVDMRLRPSGRSGPLATSFESFDLYQQNEAWTWEHMALTRARVLSASPTFTARIEKLIRAVLCRERDAAAVAGDVLEMRRAIATEKGDRDRWDIKYAAGGLIDIEFTAQYLQLVHASASPDILDTSTARVLDKAARLGLLAVEDAEVLRPAARLYHDLTQLIRLCLAGPFDPKTAGAGLQRLLARAADVPNFATLDAHLIETQARVRKSLGRVLGQE
jgi:glutamate-ammonia-ligase adenylyltransferase